MSPHSKNRIIGENGADIKRENIENSWSGALVLQKTSNLIISPRYHDENDKEMYQNVKRRCRACRAIIFANKTYFHVKFS